MIRPLDLFRHCKTVGSDKTLNTNNKRICVVLVIDDLEYGGSQRQVVELANNLDQDRFDVHVCTLSDYVPLGGQLRDFDGRLHTIV